MKRLLLAALATLLAFSPGLAQERGRHGGGFGSLGRGGFERGGGRFGSPALTPGRGPGGFGVFPAPRARAALRYRGAPYGAASGYAPEPREGFAAPPPAAPYGGGAYGGFRRGQFLPQGYWGGAVADPRLYHLRRPPKGYGWVTVGPNAYLMQRSTGLILDTAPLY